MHVIFMRFMVYLWRSHGMYGNTFSWRSSSSHGRGRQGLFIPVLCVYILSSWIIFFFTAHKNGKTELSYCSGVFFTENELLSPSLPTLFPILFQVHFIKFSVKRKMSSFLFPARLSNSLSPNLFPAKLFFSLIFSLLTGSGFCIFFWACAQTASRDFCFSFLVYPSRYLFPGFLVYFPFFIPLQRNINMQAVIINIAAVSLLLGVRSLKICSLPAEVSLCHCCGRCSFLWKRICWIVRFRRLPPSYHYSSVVINTKAHKSVVTWYYHHVVK